MFSKRLLSPIFRWYTTSLIKWEPWEDKILTDYIKQNGNKWTAISQHCLPNRSARQCQTRWNAINPDLKKGPFSSNECQLLEEGIKKYGPKWAKIQKEFLPNRNISQLIQKHNYRSAEALREKGWSEEEDKLLLKGVEEFGLKSWTKISKTYLPHRPRSQLRARYRNVLNPSLKRERKWHQEECDTLLKRVIIFGQDNWNKVAEGLPGRAPEQCYTKWLQDLDPSLNKGPWSEKETRLLWELLYRFDGAFYKAAEYLPGRNRLMCGKKFWSEMEALHQLLPDQTMQLETESKKDWIKRMSDILRNLLDKNTVLRVKPNGSIELHQTGSWSDNEAKKLEELIDKITKEKKMDPKDQLDKSDWEEIASHLTGRDVDQCKYYYTEHLKKDDTITEGTWTEEEDKILNQLVAQYGTQWNTIAEKLKNRTPRQCSYRWHRVLEYPSAVIGQRLTEQEKLLIKEGVLMFGNNWKAISATYLPHRTPYQCMRWWNFQRRKNEGVEDEEIPIKSEKDQWTEEQDKILSFIVGAQMKDNDSDISWSKVASMMPGRSAEQCRTRWLYSLQPDTGKRWTYEEEMQLLEIVQKLKLSDLKNIWPTVAKELNTGRNDWQCRRKFNYMQRTGNRFAI